MWRRLSKLRTHELNGATRKGDNVFTGMGEGKTRVMANASGLGDRIVSAVTNAVPQEGVFQVAQAFRRRVLGVEDCSEFHGHCVATVLQIPAHEAKVEKLKGFWSFALTSVLPKRGSRLAPLCVWRRS